MFHFEEMWLSHIGCEEIVHSAWNSISCFEGNLNILAKVDKCGKDLLWWNKNVFGNVRKELYRLRKLLGKAKEEAIGSGNNNRIRQLKGDINVLLDREATVWSQRSHLLRARDGDKNTKYFHSRATKRYRRNLIVGIRDDQDRWHV